MVIGRPQHGLLGSMANVSSESMELRADRYPVADLPSSRHHGTGFSLRAGQDGCAMRDALASRAAKLHNYLLARYLVGIRTLGWTISQIRRVTILRRLAFVRAAVRRLTTRSTVSRRLLVLLGAQAERA